MADDAMNGRNFRALRRLSTKANETVAEVGQTCERVPASSLPALLASGKIARVAEQKSGAPIRVHHVTLGD